MFYEALFRPKNLKDYVDEAKTLIDKSIPLQGGWVSREEPHLGQQCFYIAESGVGSIPFCDLQDIKSIGVPRWRALRHGLGLDKK